METFQESNLLIFQIKCPQSHGDDIGILPKQMAIFQNLTATVGLTELMWYKKILFKSKVIYSTPSPRLTRIFGIPEFRITRKLRYWDCSWNSVGIPHNAILRNSIIVEFRITRF